MPDTQPTKPPPQRCRQCGCVIQVPWYWPDVPIVCRKCMGEGQDRYYRHQTSGTEDSFAI